VRRCWLSLCTVLPSYSQWTKRADQLHHDNVPVHSTALVQALLAKHRITQVCQPSYSPDLAPCDFWLFPKLKIAVEREEICECDGHTVHKLSQRRLTVEWLAPRESDCSRMRSKVSSDWMPSYIKATQPLLEIFKMAGYFPDSPRTSAAEKCCPFREKTACRVSWQHIILQIKHIFGLATRKKLPLYMPWRHTEEVQVQFNLALRGGEWWTSHPGRFTPAVKNTSTHLIGWLVGSKAGLHVVPESETQYHRNRSVVAIPTMLPNRPICEGLTVLFWNGQISEFQWSDKHTILTWKWRQYVLTKRG
jgi:hypothetical protein